MRREELNRIIGEELGNIPEGNKGSAQQELRWLYNMTRRKDLGRNPNTPRSRSLQYAIERIKERNPDFHPEYDEHYFGSA
jgi:hypothetical protein